MSDPIARLKKWQERAEKLRAEIARRRARLKPGRDEPKVLQRAVASLATAEHRIANAKGPAARARIRAAKAERHAKDVAAINRRLDRIAAGAPKTMQRWARDRKDEPKRIEKRKRTLEKKLHKDLRQTPDTFGVRGNRRRRNPTLPIVAETFPSGPIIPYQPPVTADAPARAGLMPGDYRLMPASESADQARAPQRWTADYVGRRMIDAHAVLRRLPMTTRPKEFGSVMPAYVHEGVELAYQAGAGTLHMGRNRVIGGTSADDVARMNEALAWPMQFLKHDADAARKVNEWAFWEPMDREEAGGRPDYALEIITKGLNAKKVRVT